MTSGRVRVYIASSFDGFIAGPGDDLSWLEGAEGSSHASAGDTTRTAGGLGFEAFMSQVGALLMGRRTHDVVAGFGGIWPYGDRPVLVATHRPLDSVSQVRAVSGDVGHLVAQALEAAGGKDVYVDGGDLIRQCLDAGLVDEMVVTLAPVLLGRGHPLFAGVERRHGFEFVSAVPYGASMLQVTLRPQR
jgi:dihydrofolate reductase